MKGHAVGLLILALAVLILGCCSLFPPAPPPEFGGEEIASPEEQPSTAEQPPAQGPAPKQLKTAENESTISLSRQAAYSITDSFGDTQRWAYAESVAVRGKFQQLALTDFDQHLLAKYKLVDATVSWNVKNEYNVSSTTGVTHKTCTNSEIVTGSGSNKLENLDISYAIYEPVKLSEAGELILEIKTDGTYQLKGRFHAPVTETRRNTCGEGQIEDPQSIEYRLPVVGTYAGGKTIARSGSFANVGCMSQACYTDPNANRLMISIDLMSTDIPEDKGQWSAQWTLNLP